VHAEAHKSGATATLAPAQPKHHAHHGALVDDLNTLLTDKFDPTKTNLLDLPDGAVLAQGDAEEEEEYDDDEEYEEDESEEEAHVPESQKIKTQDFQPDEVDELDAFLAETSISSDSKKYFKGGSAAAGTRAVGTPQKKADGETTQKWLDSVLI
jgi:hypothetical protein